MSEALDTRARAPDARRTHPAAALAFFVGAALGMVFLSSIASAALVFATAAVCTAAWWGRALLRSPRLALRGVGFACICVTLAAYALWVYLAVAFGALLAWTVPAWGAAALALIAVGTLGTRLRPPAGIRLPLALPLGAWIALVLSGWPREERLLRCDDYLEVARSLRIVVPSHPELSSCRPGEVRPSGRYPRTFWEAPEGGRLVFTTQGDAIEGGLDSPVCEVIPGEGGATCIGGGYGKAQGFVEIPDRDRLLVFEWGVRTPQGGMGSVIYELPLRRRAEVLAVHRFDEPLGEGFFEPRTSTLYAFSDRMDGIHPILLPGFEPAPVVPVSFAPGELRYDAERGRGVACGKNLGAAVRGEPLELREFARSGAWLGRVSVTWGCDWDPEADRVFTTVPNLGLLVELEYSTGRVLRTWFVGLGMRSVEHDPVRRRVYFTDFLRGYVHAFDLRTERVTARWFVGRYARFVRLTRDGSALLATSNVGIVRIPLDE